MEFEQKAKKGILDRLTQCLIREKLVPCKVKHNVIIIGLQEEKSIHIHMKRKYQLNRFVIAEIVFHESGRISPIHDPIQLLEQLQSAGLFPASEETEGFKKELANSSANYALGLKKFAERQKEWLVNKEAHANSINWIGHTAAEDEFFSPLAFFEQLAVHGHTLHPCTKTKMGMSAEEVKAYSPECGGKPAVVYATVHKSLTSASLLRSGGVKELLFLQNEGLQEVFEQELNGCSMNPGEYELIPLHPWQAEHVLPDLYIQELQEKRIVLLHGWTEPSYALSSLRTLLPLAKGRNQPFHLKTAIRVQATSAVRTVSPASAMHGPMFTGLFRALARTEHFPSGLKLLAEEAGIHFKDSESEEREKNLAAMIRENPERSVAFHEGELAVPGVALISDSPFGNGSVLLEAVRLYKRTMNDRSLEQAAVNWIRDYSRLLFESCLPLMTRYGIALEAHLQNSIPVLKHGVPVRLIVRDYGGIKILNQRLRKAGHEFVFQVDTHVEAKNEAALQDTVSHALIQNHLGELIIQLVQELNMDELPLWEAAAEELERVFDELAEDPDAVSDRTALMEEELSLKSLVGMRLNHTIDNTYTKVPNPFATITRGGSKRAELQNGNETKS
ncbi:IucA/IucC family protein [Bacillus sp. FJAT-42376]|uniref:IucA/IucC family protein n=1 Tax=Bacillus sp. FJAT-42376 TaxID=2014076 RepID=UPI0013DE6B75|nr:IucA/IucC family protein [Bacillus sp. FJAT-42376]